MADSLVGLHLVVIRPPFQVWADGPDLTRIVRLCTLCGQHFEDPAPLETEQQIALAVLTARLLDDFHIATAHNLN